MNVHQTLLSSWRIKGGSGYETICDLDVDEISATDQDQELGLIMHLSMIPPIGQMMGIIWGLAQDAAPIVGNLITSDCIVKSYDIVSNPQ